MPDGPDTLRRVLALSCLMLLSTMALGALPASAQDAAKGAYVVPDRFSGQRNQDSDPAETGRDRDLGLRGRGGTSRGDDVTNDRAPFAASPRFSNQPAAAVPDRPAPFGIQGRDQPANSWAR